MKKEVEFVEAVEYNDTLRVVGQNAPSSMLEKAGGFARSAFKFYTTGDRGKVLSLLLALLVVLASVALAVAGCWLFLKALYKLILSLGLGLVLGLLRDTWQTVRISIRRK